MIENKNEKEESEDEEEEEEEDDESEDKNDKKEVKKNEEKKSIKENNKITENNKKREDKITNNNKKSENKDVRKSITSQSKTKEKENINEKYTEKEIIKNAGFKIEKSSKKSEEELEDKKREIPFEEKLIKDPPEILNLRIHAAKIRNEFPKWNKIDKTKGGDLAIKCWNCDNINICNYNMNIIQCPICNEMNKVPKVMDRIDELLMLAKANTCTSYADINHTVPLVNYIVVCPYCKCDNKVRETACFCICYMCKNKWTIKRPDSDEIKEEKKRKPPKQRGLEGNYYKYDSKTGRILPPDRPMRFSDLFYPDPMFYPGYYPINSLSPLYPEYFTPYDDYRYIDRQEKTIKYFDRVNQQRKLIEKFGNILEDENVNKNKDDFMNNNINKENNRYEKPYYHINYENNIEKRDIMRQLEDLDRKSENLMKSRLFPNQEVKSSQNSLLTIKSRYGKGETSSLYEKTKTSQKISTIKSDMKYSKLSKSNNNLSINNLTSKDKKGKESTSKSKSKSKSKNKRSSMGDLSGKLKSIENTYFLKNNE